MKAGNVEAFDPSGQPGELELLLELGLDPDTVVAECDGVVLKREEYDTHLLTEGSVLELIRFVGGG